MPLIELQDTVKAQIFTAADSLEGITGLLKTYALGGSFHLAFIFHQLAKLGLGPRDTFDKIGFRNAFLRRLLRVADESQTYIREGVDPPRVFTLKEGFIYGVCPLSSAVRKAQSWNCVKFVFKRRLTRNRYISRALA